jgi:hypothetical protein
MPRKKQTFAGHAGRTATGHTRDVKVERIGKVTVYKRGDVYYLYYRQGGASQRRRVDGNLAVARATAHKVMTALDEGKPSPVAYLRTSPEKLTEGYLDAVANVQKLALRTQDRYRAALDRFLDFCQTARISTVSPLATHCRLVPREDLVHLPAVGRAVEDEGVTLGARLVDVGDAVLAEEDLQFGRVLLPGRDAEAGCPAFDFRVALLVPGADAHGALLEGFPDSAPGRPADRVPGIVTPAGPRGRGPW